MSKSHLAILPTDDSLEVEVPIKTWSERLLAMREELLEMIAEREAEDLIIKLRS